MTASQKAAALQLYQQTLLAAQMQTDQMQTDQMQTDQMHTEQVLVMVYYKLFCLIHSLLWLTGFVCLGNMPLNYCLINLDFFLFV